MKIEKHIVVDRSDTNAVDLLAQSCDLSKSQIKHAMICGALWLTRGSKTQRLRRAKRVLNIGDELHLYFNDLILNAEVANPVLVADEGIFSVWDKPCGMLSQGSKWGDHTTIARQIEIHLKPQRPAFIVHRLDRAASGLILIAHSQSMAAKLSALFADRSIEKHYQVWVHGRLEVSHKTIEQSLDGKNAISEIHTLAYQNDHDISLIDVNIKTGRKHQIRKHMVGLGHPVLGDRLYSRFDEESDACDLQLRAVDLRFSLDNQNYHYQVAGLSNQPKNNHPKH